MSRDLSLPVNRRPMASVAAVGAALLPRLALAHHEEVAAYVLGIFALALAAAVVGLIVVWRSRARGFWLLLCSLAIVGSPIAATLLVADATSFEPFLFVPLAPAIIATVLWLVTRARNRARFDARA